jgi:hypothetical protein
MSQQEFTNSFLQGVNRDDAPDKLAPDTLRSLQNFRIDSVTNRRFSPTNIEGNEEAFSITDGFIPFGAKEYGGVLFIFSTNPITGEGEIGTYPSPLPSGTGGYDHVYSALRNWTGAVNPTSTPNPTRLDLRTSLFGFGTRHVEIEIALSYDGSLDIHFADWLNPLRSINSGFNHETGVYNNRYYWQGSIPNSISSTFETCPHPTVDQVLVQPGGQWPAGITVFYARLLDSNLEKTSFLCESRPVQVSSSTGSTGVSTDGDAANVNTGKQVRLFLTDIDVAFKFVEIAFSYRSDLTTEIGLINRLYQIDPLSSSLIIDITGQEDVLELTFDEIIARKPLADTPRSITQHQARMWGVNWKERFSRNDLMYAAAQQILATPTPSIDLIAEEDQDFRTSTSSLLGHKDYQDTFQHIGYFRGEPYAFAVVWVFKDGKESRAFPVRGYDAWLDPGAVTTNQNGVLRMPSNMNPNYAFYQNRGIGNRIYVLGVRFDTSALVLPQWMIDNVCGYYFVRAERKAQLLYQGHVANGFTPQSGGPWEVLADATIGSADGRTFTSNILPEFSQGYGDGSTVVIATRRKAGCDPGDISFDDSFINLSRRVGRFGIFSTDHFFSASLSNGTYKALIQGRTTLNRFTMSATRTPTNLWEQRAFAPGSLPFDSVSASPNFGDLSLYNVAPANYSPTNGFVSKFSEAGLFAEANGYPSFFYAWNDVGGCRREWGNRDIQQRGYIGADTSPTPNFDNSLRALADDVALVNIYLSDPSVLDVANLYNPFTELYRRISNFLPISGIGAIGSQSFYRGDCFVQRVYHRQTCDTGTQSSDYASAGLFYKYGNMIGVVQECITNGAMRMNVNGNVVYYPYALASDPAFFAAEFGPHLESTAYNKGYNRVLGDYARQGYDALSPNSSLNYTVRLAYSGAKATGEVIDGYRRWDLASYKDFDPSAGQMVKVFVDDGRLFTVQELDTNLHYVLERGVIGDGQGGSLVIGEGEILSSRFQAVGKGVGSQNQWSIIKGSLGWYGYDHRRRSVWRFSSTQGMQEISITKKFSSDVFDVAELISGHGDIVHTNNDSPSFFGGVSSWMSQRHKEVGWTFIVATSPITTRSLVFSEVLDQYLHQRSHDSGIYATIGSDLYSADPAFLPWRNPVIPRGIFYRHDSATAPRTSFYGRDPQSFLGFVSAPSPDKTKVYHSSHLFGSAIAPSTVFCSSGAQFGSLAPFVPLPGAPPTFRPTYKENAWRHPLPRAASVITGTDYGVGSPLRGSWLTLEYHWDSGEEVWAQSAVTTFSLSNT